MGRLRRSIVSAVMTVLSGGDVNTRREVGHQWAEPIVLGGVPNLHKVSDELYRSAQPTLEGFRALEKLGIKSVLSFRTRRTDRMLAASTSLVCKSIPFFGVCIFDDDIVEIMRSIHCELPKPVLMHCYQGADRTGLVCAIYRMLFQRWSREESIQEMTRGGFGRHALFRNHLKYLKNLNIDELLAQLN